MATAMMMMMVCVGARTVLMTMLIYGLNPFRPLSFVVDCSGMAIQHFDVLGVGHLHRVDYNVCCIWRVPINK